MFHSPAGCAVEFPNVTAGSLLMYRCRRSQPGGRMRGARSGGCVGIPSKYPFQVLGWLRCWAVHHQPRQSLPPRREYSQQFLAANVEVVKYCGIHMHFYFSSIPCFSAVIYVFPSTLSHIGSCCSFGIAGFININFMVYFLDSILNASHSVSFPCIFELQPVFFNKL